LGVFGAILPIIVIAVGYQAIFNIVNQKLDTVFIEMLPVTPLIPQLSFLMLLIGGVIGVWGSLTSVRKFLKI
jgi:cell division transport system permease protein